MMLRRRMPRPTGPSTWTPSSSGPRCRIASHICRITAGETGWTGSVWTMPTMPHMSGGVWSKRRAARACRSARRDCRAHPPIRCARAALARAPACPAAQARSLFHREGVTESDRLSVLHLIAPGDVGGAERVVHALASGQRRAGHRVTVGAVLSNGADHRSHPFLAPLERAGVETILLRVPPRAYRRERSACVELCRRLRPDVVHTHGIRVDVVDAAVARRAGMPTVTTVHGFTGGDFKMWVYERLWRRALRGFDAVVAVSRPLARDLERTGVPPGRLHAVPNAWPADDLPPFPRYEARQQLAVPDGRFHVGWVGRLTPEKGADVLLAALPLLADLPMVVSVVGDGRGRPQLQAAAARLGLGDRVRWLGNVAAGPDDPAALAQAIRAVHADPAAAAERARRAQQRLGSEFAPGPWLARYERIYRSVG